MGELLTKVEKTVRFHAARAMRTSRSLRWRLSRPALVKPIFVVGCSRAGTTLIYKTLSESRQIGSLQRETHDFWAGLHPPAERAWSTHALAAENASRHDRDSVSCHFFADTGHLRIVDKNNQNGLCVGYLLALFPDAQFVYIKRSPGDNLNSLIEGWGKADEFATWSGELPARVNIDGGRYQHWCFFLFEGWQRFANATIEEVCAAQYYAMNRAILNTLKAVPQGQWIQVQYEALIHDPVDGFQKIFEFCGLDFTPALHSHCADVLSTPYNAFSEIRIGKWRDGHNRARIEQVLPRLAEIAGEMGYDLHCGD